MAGFMTKKKKYLFSVILNLEGLSSVPFINGQLYAKVRLRSGGNFEKCSPSTEVQEHSVKWETKFEFTCRMSADASSGVLNSCYLRISVRKEAGRSCLKLGFVDLDLAEYAGAGLSSSKRFLLEPYSNAHQRSDNSTLKLSLELSLIHGDPLFKRPSCSSSTFYDGCNSVTAHTPQGSNDAKDEEKRVVEYTRVDPAEIVKQLVDQHLTPQVPLNRTSDGERQTASGAGLAEEEDEEDVVGLELLVGKDGTATLGSRSGTNERKKKNSNNKKKYISNHRNE